MRSYAHIFLKPLLALCLLVGFISCQPASDETKSTDKAQELVDLAIAAHGGERFDNMQVSFNFRDRHYTAQRRNGIFEYTREFDDSLGRVKDVLNNDGLYREVNGNRITLPEERQTAFANSVNSVIYFALLPYGLNDEAVIKEYLGETTIKSKPYHKLKVTFRQEGGGSDHEDEYIYWINPENHRVDYLAYSFQVNEGGMRFREAYNVRDIKGILFADYINYEPASDTLVLEQLETAFENGGLKKLSEINLENIKVETK